VQNKDLPCKCNWAKAREPLCSPAVDHPATLPFQAAFAQRRLRCVDETAIPDRHSGHEARRTDFNLEALSLKELRQLQKELAKAISTYEDRDKAEARAKLDAIAKEMGYSLADLIGTEVKSTRTLAAAKYRHPENPSLLWLPPVMQEVSDPVGV
jgi:DNA-binding protein H-NS